MSAAEGLDWRNSGVFAGDASLGMSTDPSIAEKHGITTDGRARIAAVFPSFRSQTQGSFSEGRTVNGADIFTRQIAQGTSRDRNLELKDMEEILPISIGEGKFFPLS